MKAALPPESAITVYLGNILETPAIGAARGRVSSWSFRSLCACGSWIIRKSLKAWPKPSAVLWSSALLPLTASHTPLALALGSGGLLEVPGDFWSLFGLQGLWRGLSGLPEPSLAHQDAKGPLALGIEPCP